MGEIGEVEGNDQEGWFFWITEDEKSRVFSSRADAEEEAEGFMIEWNKGGVFKKAAIKRERDKRDRGNDGGDSGPTRFTKGPGRDDDDPDGGGNGGEGGASPAIQAARFAAWRGTGR